MEAILKYLLINLIALVGYAIGYFPVLIGTLCNIEPGPFEDIDPYCAYKRSYGMKWWHVTYEKNGVRYLPSPLVALVGWLMVGLLVAFVLFVLSHIGIDRR